MIKMPTRHPVRGVQKIAGYTKLKPRKMIKAGDKNLGAIRW